MRLSNKEIDCIRVVIKSKDPFSKIYLFGSRTQDFLRGGDIDLLILSDVINFSDRIDLLVEMKSKLGDQKIDLLVRKFSNYQDDPFVLEILESAVLL